MAKITNWRHNRVWFEFDNGFKLSVTFGAGSYCENHNKAFEGDKYNSDAWNTFFMDGSHDVEIMITETPKGGERLYRAIYKKYDSDGSVIGYLPVSDLYKIIEKINNYKIKEKHGIQKIN